MNLEESVLLIGTTIEEFKKKHEEDLACASKEIEMWRRRFLDYLQLGDSGDKEETVIMFSFLYAPCSEILKDGPEKVIEENRKYIKLHEN